MKRALLTAVVATLTLSPFAWGARATVRYYDRGTQKEEIITNAVIVSESPIAVSIQVGTGKPRELKVIDLREIEYEAPAGVSALDYRAPFVREYRALEVEGEERKALLLEALKLYQGLTARLAGEKLLRRNVDFRMAEVLTRLAELDSTRRDAAISALQKFIADHGESWHLTSAIKTLARVQEQKKDEAGAQATYERAADNPNLPEEVRNEFGLLMVRYLLRKGKHADAEQRARALSRRITSSGANAVKVQVYLAACDIASGRLDGVENPLKQVVEGEAADPYVKALAYNTLGDYYRARGKPEEAFWQYLWVDVYYNQDREELARALYHLANLFNDTRKDTLRSKEYRERLLDEKEFGDLEYHRRARAEQTKE